MKNTKQPNPLRKNGLFRGSLNMKYLTITLGCLCLTGFSYAVELPEFISKFASKKAAISQIHLNLIEETRELNSDVSLAEVVRSILEVDAFNCSSEEIRGALSDVFLGAEVTNALKYEVWQSGSDYRVETTKSSNLYNDVARKQYGLRAGQEIVYMSNHIGGLYSIYDPLEDKLTYGSMPLSGGLLDFNIFELDPTIVDFSNLLIPLEGREVKFEESSPIFTISVTRSGWKGYEKQVYEVRDDYPYLMKMDALISGNNMRAYRFFLDYRKIDKHETIGVDSLFPRFMIELISGDGGESSVSVRIFEVSVCSNDDVSSKDLEIAITDNTKIKSNL